MNLADALIGSVVFAVASSASVQLTARMGHQLLQQRSNAERMEQIDLAMIASEQALRRSASQRPNPDPACSDPAALLVTLLESSALVSLPPGLQRRVVVTGQRRVRLLVSGSNPALDRSRVFTAGALGLCPPVAEPPSVMAQAVSTP